MRTWRPTPSMTRIPGHCWMRSRPAAGSIRATAWTGTVGAATKCRVATTKKKPRRRKKAPARPRHQVPDDELALTGGLSPRQQLFVQHYLLTMNATEAARQ